MKRADELVPILTGCEWFMDRLRDIAAVEVPDSWIGAGAIRDLVWDERFGDGFDPENVRDVDVAFFDARDLTAERDAHVEDALLARNPTVRWDAKNQARVHVWYPERFGVEVEPLQSAADGIATWPEYATCVGARLTPGGTIELAAPHGLDDLLDGVWRCNPVRVTSDEYGRRLERKNPATRWPGVRIVAG